MAALSFLSRIIPKKHKAYRFLGLVLRESSAVAYAFEQTDTDVEIVKSKRFEYSKSFEKVLDDTDETIYEFESELKYQFKKIIFILPVCGLKNDGKDVQQPYRAAISEIVHNLDLEAMGYIEMLDVLKEDMSPLESAVYIEVGKMKTQIVFVRNGEQWNQLAISTNPANVASHLTEFVTKGTKVFVYSINDGANTNALLAALSDYSVRLCKTEDISISLRNLLVKQLIPQTPSEGQAQDGDTDISAVAAVPEITQNTPMADEASLVIDSQAVTVPTDTDSLGSDAAQTVSPENPPDSVEGFKIYNSSPTKSDDGYVHEPPQPKTYATPQAFAHPQEQAQGFDPAPLLEVQSGETSESEQNDGEDGGATIIDNEEPKNKSKKKILFKSIAMSLGIILTIALAGLIVFEMYLHKVTVKISVPTETFEVKQALSGLAVSKIIEEKNVDVSVNTTGKREIGERGKGTVVIASFDDKEASFSAGTKLYLDDSVFTLDADVVLPPSTVDTSSGTKQASKKTAPASASFIGTEGNISKGKQFGIEDYPSALYYGLSDTDFTGGSQQTVSVVSDEDVEKLNELVADHAKQTSESAKAGTAGDAVTLDEISTIDTGELNYSAEVGEVASEVRAEGSVKAVLYTVQKGKLFELLQKAVVEEKGKSFQFLNEGITYAFRDVVLSDDEQTCDVGLETTLNIFQAVNIGEIKKDIKLRLNSQATDILQKKYKVSQARYESNPTLPVFQSFIPYSVENIEVHIEPVGSP